MKFFTLTKLGRTLLLLTAVAAVVVVGLLGCGGGDNPSGGGGNNNSSGGSAIMGDWMILSTTSNGTTTVIDTSKTYTQLRFKSSGEYCSRGLAIGAYDVCTEMEMCWGTWRVVGSTFYHDSSVDGVDSGCRDYTIFNNELSIGPYENGYILTYIRSDIDSWKRSHCQSVVDVLGNEL
jgi:hypothetical protein